MSLTNALSEKYVSLSASDSVETALKALDRKDAESAAVVNQQGSIEGVFSLYTLLKNLLPIGLSVGDLPLSVGAAPGLAQRLNKIPGLNVGDVMDRKVPVLPPETSIWEAVNLLLGTSTPVFVAEQGSGKAIGVITIESVFKELNRTKEAAR